MTPILQAKSREILGRKVRNLRKAGLLPAVLYGEGVPSQSISVPHKEFEKVYKEAGESTILKVDLEGKSYNVLIHDIAHDPIKGAILHADLYAVRMDKMLQTKVSLDFIGESAAVKNDGAVLLKVMQEIEVEALPQNLPHDIKVDLSLLSAIGSKVLVKDLQLSQGVRVLAEGDDVIAIAEPPRSEEDLASLKEIPTAEIKEVTTEQEVKRAEAATKEKDEEEKKK